MNTGKIEIIYGKGHGKTAMALGKGLIAVAKQKKVVVIQFLKGGQLPERIDVVRRLEPEMSLFRFEKSRCDFEHLSEEAKQEECRNILNALNYAKKVLTTGECDLLILDGVLGLLDQEIFQEEDLIRLLDYRSGTDVILTGRTFPSKVALFANEIECINQVGAD